MCFGYTSPRMSKDTAQPFAVIETGGKQYKVQVGDTISIEKISGKEMKEGDKVIFDKVLLSDDGKNTDLGDPYVKSVKVQGVLEGQGKAKKLEVVRFRSKSRYHRRYGHRQPFMKVKITSLK